MTTQVLWAVLAAASVFYFLGLWIGITQTREERDQMSDFKYGLGYKLRDSITGFEGVVVGRGDHITGCNTYGLQPGAKDGKYEESRWFDENRLTVIDADVTRALPDDLRAQVEARNRPTLVQNARPVETRRTGAGPNPEQTRSNPR